MDEYNDPVPWTREHPDYLGIPDYSLGIPIRGLVDLDKCSCAKQDEYEEEIDLGFAGKPRALCGPRPMQLDPNLGDVLALTPYYSKRYIASAAGGQTQMKRIINNYDPAGNVLPYTGNLPTTWDGIPLDIDPAASDHTLARDWLFPFSDGATSWGGNFTLRGLDQLWDSEPGWNPSVNPTPAQLEQWQLRVLTHFRSLVTFNGQPLPVPEYDPDLFKRALWSTERKGSTVWNVAYPEDTCPPESGLHCGANFVPDHQDQIFYDNSYFSSETWCHDPWPSVVVYKAGAEGIHQWFNGGMKYAFSRLIRQIVSNTTGTGLSFDGHAGPFWTRKYLGYQYQGTTHPGAIRIKWRD